MAGFMRQVAGYQDGGMVDPNNPYAEEDEADLAVMPPRPKPLGLPFTQADITQSILAAKQKLSADRSADDRAAKWLAFSAAVGKPTRTGTLGEAASNVAEAMGKVRSQQRSDERQSLVDMLGIDAKLYDILSDEKTKQAQYQQQLAKSLIQNQRPIGQPNYQVNKLGQTVVTAQYPGGYTVQYNMQDPSQVTMVQTPIPGIGGALQTSLPGAAPAKVGAGATPSPLQTAAAPPTAAPPSPLQAAAAPPVTKPKSYPFQGKTYAVGEQGQDADKRPFVMGEGGVPVYTGEVPLSVKTAQEVSAATGKAAGEAKVIATNAWPKIQTMADEQRVAIQDLRTSPGLSSIVGWNVDPLKGSLGASETKNPQSGDVTRVPRVVPGTPAASAYEAYKRVFGSVFLQGYQDALRGTGPVATKEGEISASARAAIGLGQQENMFNRRLDDYDASVIRATRTAQQLKGDAPSYGLPPRDKQQAQEGQVYVTPSGVAVKAVRDPATKKIEMYPVNSYWSWRQKQR